MKIGIMQPYYFPYPGYFSLIRHVDEFILFDPVQFIRHGWIDRNRILKPSEGWQYINVPLEKHSRETAIRDIVVDYRSDWRRKTLAQLQHYRKTAPFYRNAIAVMETVFSRDYRSVTELNLAAMREVCGYLGIRTPLRVFSEMGLTLDKVNAPDEWALNICVAMGNVAEYWNPPGGESFFDRDKYARKGISLRFHRIVPTVYDQRRTEFESGLSIIDAIMFNSSDRINEMLDDYELF